MEKQIFKKTQSPVMDKLLLELDIQFFADNKVKFGLEGVHYALQIEDNVTGAVTFGDVKPYPGAVNLTLDPRGGQTEFYADNRAYYVTYVNNGFDGTFETAEVPQEFRVEVLDEILTAENILVENKNAKIKRVALMFQFQGDIKNTRHVVYGVDFTRPSVNGATATDTVEPQTTTLTFIANGLNDRVKGLNITKASTTATTDDTAYNNFYQAVFVPTVTPPVTPPDENETP